MQLYFTSFLCKNQTKVLKKLYKFCIIILENGRMSGKMRNESVWKLALASICAAFSTTLLTIGFYTGIGDFIWYFASSFLFIPMLCMGMLKESVIAFSVTSILCLVMIGFNYIYVLPFAVLFGYYPMLYYWHSV